MCLCVRSKLELEYPQMSNSKELLLKEKHSYCISQLSLLVKVPLKRNRMTGFSIAFLEVTEGFIEVMDSDRHCIAPSCDSASARLHIAHLLPSS